MSLEVGYYIIILIESYNYELVVFTLLDTLAGYILQSKRIAYHGRDLLWLCTLAALIAVDHIFDCLAALISH